MPRRPAAMLAAAALLLVPLALSDAESLAGTAPDTFGAGLDGWMYKEVSNELANMRYCGVPDRGAYATTHSAEHGGSAHTGPAAGCWVGMAGAAKLLEPGSSGTLLIELDYRTLSSNGRHTNNMSVVVEDSAGNLVHNEELYQGPRERGTGDTGWRTAAVTIPSVDAGACPCEIFIYLADAWVSEWNQQNYFDNVRVSVLRDGAAGHDRDGDGVPDLHDSCPNHAGAGTDGCAAGHDGDGDGLPDDADLCPGLAGTKPHGCPDRSDRDGDGVRSTTDHCPDTPGVAPYGCPPDDDPDGDGLAYPYDRCRDLAGTGFDGCPPRDPDGDGVPAPYDSCPDRAGVKFNGCPADYDGVPNSWDGCPGVYGAGSDGCPDGGGDPDGDGVPNDGTDLCPDRAGLGSNGCHGHDIDGDGVQNDTVFWPGTDVCPGVRGIGPHGCPAGDVDGDLVPNPDDVCPYLAGTGTDGCPLAGGDRDGDGISDDADRCPDTAAVTDADLDGCTDAVILDDVASTGKNTAVRLDPLANDTGADLSVTGAALVPVDSGSLDPTSGAGPFTFTPATDYVGEVALTFTISDGPEITDLSSQLVLAVNDTDTDGDGVPDGLDRCPGTPAGTEVDGDGCPVSNTSDRDGDGIPDDKDQCPDHAPYMVDPHNRVGRDTDLDNNGCEDGMVRNDTWRMDQGTTVTLRPLDNDRQKGLVIVEMVPTPDIGVLEKVPGTETFRYTPPADYVGKVFFVVKLSDGTTQLRTELNLRVEAAGQGGPSGASRSEPASMIIWSMHVEESGSWVMHKAEPGPVYAEYAVDTGSGPKTAEITLVWDGTVFVPFADGMTVPTDMPKFRGTSGGIDSIQILMCGSQVGGNRVSDDGTFWKSQKTPVPDGTCPLEIVYGGATLFSASITLDADGDGNPAPDTTAPAISPPDDAAFEATGVLTQLTGSQTGLPAVSDDADPEPAVTSDAPKGYPLGATAVTWTATDSAGNSASAVQTITIQDTTPPAFDPPVLGNAAPGGLALPAAADLVDGDVAVVSSHDLGGPFPPGTTVVTFTAADSAGNSASMTQNVTVEGPAETAAITLVWDGADWTGFTDGMTVPTDMPKFRGISEGIDSIQILMCGNQVGGSRVSEDGTFWKSQKTPVPDGTCQLEIAYGGEVLFSSAITIDADADDDGVPDNVDRCPGSAAAADADSDGCTDAVINDDIAVAEMDTAVRLDPLYNDTGADLGVTAAVINPPGSGTLEGVPGIGPFTFTPAAGFAGEAAITFEISDGPAITGLSSRLALTISGADDGTDTDGDGVPDGSDRCPDVVPDPGRGDDNGDGCTDAKVHNDVRYADRNTTATLDPLWNDSGTGLVITAAKLRPNVGVLEGVPGGGDLTFTPPEGFAGRIMFTFTILDGPTELKTKMLLYVN